MSTDCWRAVHVSKAMRLVMVTLCNGDRIQKLLLINIFNAHHPRAGSPKFQIPPPRSFTFAWVPGQPPGQPTQRSLDSPAAGLPVGAFVHGEVSVDSPEPLHLHPVPHLEAVPQLLRQQLVRALCNVGTLGERPRSYRPPVGSGAK